ncbi:MAG TPA: hypothetical protein O0X39_01150 [Methanocorpusculum sp.]|nr:hypothetical protein [Methanocorpusculum sp.]
MTAKTAITLEIPPEAQLALILAIRNELEVMKTQLAGRELNPDAKTSLKKRIEATEQVYDDIWTKAYQEKRGHTA